MYASRTRKEQFSGRGENCQRNVTDLAGSLVTSSRSPGRLQKRPGDRTCNAGVAVRTADGSRRTADAGERSHCRWHLPHNFGSDKIFSLLHKGLEYAKIAPVPKVPGPPAKAWFLWSTGVHTPDRISIGSAVFAQLMIIISRHTHTDRVTSITHLPRICSSCVRCSLKCNKWSK